MPAITTAFSASRRRALCGALSLSLASAVPARADERLSLLRKQLVTVTDEIGAVYDRIHSIADEHAAEKVLLKLYRQQQTIEDQLAELPPPTTLADATVWACIATSGYCAPVDEFSGLAARKALAFLVEVQS